MGKARTGPVCESTALMKLLVGGTVGYSIFTRDVFSSELLLTLGLTRKTKKDHQNWTIINEITAIYVLVKVLFLWTIIQAQSPKIPISRLVPCLGPSDLTNKGQKCQIPFLTVYHFGPYGK